MPHDHEFVERDSMVENPPPSRDLGWEAAAEKQKPVREDSAPKVPSEE